MQILGWHEDQNIRIDIRWVGGSDPGRMQTEIVDFDREKARGDRIRHVRGYCPGFANSLYPDRVRRHHRSSQPRFRQELGAPAEQTAYEASLGGKWIETLKELWPNLRRAGVLYEPPTAPYMPGILQSIPTAAPVFGVEVVDVGVRDVRAQRRPPVSCLACLS